MTVVGTFEAKTKLSELLDRVERGEEFVITRHGKPVAKLAAPDLPTLPEPTRGKRATVEEIEAIAREFQKKVKEPFTSADINTILYDEDGLPK
jgi:antitoxin (DNA-binding transcriptional repressor) of toxin-antitoxin stability system